MDEKASTAIYYFLSLPNHILVIFNIKIMDKQMISLTKRLYQTPLYILCALLLAFTGCGDDDEPDTTPKAKLTFKVYECQSPLKSTEVTNGTPAANAEINIYSKTNDQYALIKTLKTNDKGIAEFEGESEKTIHYEVKKDKSTNLYNGYIIVGVFVSEEDIANSPFQGPDTKPGDLKFKDVNCDAIISADDKVEKYASKELGEINSSDEVIVYIAPTL